MALRLSLRKEGDAGITWRNKRWIQVYGVVPLDVCVNRKTIFDGPGEG